MAVPSYNPILARNGIIQSTHSGPMKERYHSLKYVSETALRSEHSKNMTSLLDMHAISGKYLFPQNRKLKKPYWVHVTSIELACYHRIVSNHGLTLVHFHGNGEAVSDYVPFFADLFQDMGLNQLFIEYRGYGGSSGQAKLVAMLDDGDGVLQAAGIRPENAVVFGRSIGSLYAIELAYRQPNLAGLIIESGIADPCERFLNYADLQSSGISESEVRAEAAKYFNHELKLSNYFNPLLILHAEHDGLIDLSHAQRNDQWASSNQKRLVQFPNGNHNTIFQANIRAYLTAVQEFVEGLGR
jgi:pimeloyl-ACP methyl ester carboxylesterase